ncbi:hypothetical protein LINGRAHAP2_LOCUS34689 [Linum grandiflorum]
MYLDKESCMRLRVKLDVRKSLLREKEVKKPSSSIMVTFKYEKLPIFCFLCGRIGHINRACAVRFHFARNTELRLLWDASLRAPQRRILKEIKESVARSYTRGTKGGYAEPRWKCSEGTNTKSSSAASKHPSNGVQLSIWARAGRHICFAWSGY